eukprot:EG_transcript_17408
MYSPADPYQVQDTAVAKEVFNKYPFATLIVTQDNVPHVTHLPVLYDEATNTLRGHLARANPTAKLDLAKATNCLVVFQGPNSYISPVWYPSKAESGGKVVPTWDYVTVHAEGKFTLIQDKEWTRDIVAQLSLAHEATLQSDWTINDAPKSYVDVLLRMIVGFEVSITSTKMTGKLQQNKCLRDVQGVVEGLERGKGQDVPGSLAVAQWMRSLTLSGLEAAASACPVAKDS